MVKLLNTEITQTSEELEPPEIFKSNLFTHQKQALYWMNGREKDCLMDRDLHPLWEEFQMYNGQCLYFNPFIGKISFKMPDKAM